MKKYMKDGLMRQPARVTRRKKPTGIIQLTREHMSAIRKDKVKMTLIPATSSHFYLRRVRYNYG